MGAKIQETETRLKIIDSDESLLIEKLKGSSEKSSYDYLKIKIETDLNL